MSRPHSSRVAAVSIVVVVLALVLFTDLAFCPTRRLFGVPCPGCGLTRAMRSMLMLDFGAMLRFHPFAPIVVLIGGWEFFRLALREHRLRPTPRGVWLGVVLAFLGLYVLRLMGHLGGLPDPVEPGHGALGTMFSAIGFSALRAASYRAFLVDFRVACRGAG